jgi:hypothetical protein
MTMGAEYMAENEAMDVCVLFVNSTRLGLESNLFVDCHKEVLEVELTVVPRF